MQEGQVSWDPVYINRTLPWESRFLVLYLLLVLGVSLVKSVGLARRLWSLLNEQVGSPSETRWRE